MNPAHLHLIFNHFPIIIPIIGFLVMVIGFAFRSELLKRAALGLFIFGSILTLPAFGTGEDAEEVIENLPGIEEKYIEIHEEAAETFAYLSYGLGVLSLIGFWANWKEKSMANFLSLFVLLFAVVVLFFAKEAGTTGGEISHPEIREGFVTQVD
ncbi:Uncharacterized membrane protein [Aquiflexum balticum DSM 16537]|uniref:Uncharacterized membrane protein n=1 Tax=Aquiflexum balticum DSM 16537 TaxID=758820 RepID=A0A1W2H0L7_9BACT|nr:hypothetical protein [Aquiflexum balticum]SMD42178.1 Uncharacterized membrane protein [Aquiflexum balticum DSM 16537]